MGGLSIPVLVRVLVLVIETRNARTTDVFENDDEHEHRFAEHAHE